MSEELTNLREAIQRIEQSKSRTRGGVGGQTMEESSRATFKEISLRDLEALYGAADILAQRDAEVELMNNALREIAKYGTATADATVRKMSRIARAALSTPTETADGDVRRQALEAMPPAIHRLSRAESEAVAEIIPVAEDLSMRGDESATVALAWLRALASQDKGER